MSVFRKSYKNTTKAIIDYKFTENYNNTSYISTKENTELLNIFEIYPQTEVTSVQISFTQQGKLKVLYVDPTSIYHDKTQVIYFDGKFKNNGCYEIYTQKKTRNTSFIPNLLQ